ncbi:hypothetical protein [Halorussus caseinilyticus]|uniref:AbrB/MazE/SpoVT family DNA-binding domain-containing protein n=1 Tax=Halorussus caseinilyticus TaxID=3034025 RepID=A0ABD5WM49_9EURY|nr:hypothetical protein [Halorussus sp. DT72]
MTDEMEEKILGTTTVTQRWRISLIKAVREELEKDADEIEEGDRLVYKLADGKIVIELA